jgi:hypothetical protein
MSGTANLLHVCMLVIEFETHVSLTANQNVPCSSGTCSLHSQLLTTDFRHTSIHQFLTQTSLIISFSYNLTALLISSIQSPAASLHPHPHVASSKQASNMESTDHDDASDSDDMSAGARLMRYNIFDKPRLDCRSFDLGSHRRSSNTTPQRRLANASTILSDLQEDSREATRRASAWTLDSRSVSIGGNPQDSNRFPEDPALFRRDLTNLKDIVLRKNSDHQFNRGATLQFSKFRPPASLSDRNRAWRIADASKGRARPRGIPKRKLRLALCATRSANRAAFKQLTLSLPQPLATRLTQYRTSKTRTTTRSRCSQPQDRQMSHIDHLRHIFFVRTPQRLCE